MSESTKAELAHPLVAIDRLEAFIASALVVVGIPADDATEVAKLMAEADAYGGDAHGSPALSLQGVVEKGLAV